MELHSLDVGQSVRILNGDEVSIVGTGLTLRVVDGGMFKHGNLPSRPSLVIELTKPEPVEAGAKTTRTRKAKAPE